MDKKIETKFNEELPGILNWAIAGCLKWLKNGFEPPAAVMSATSEYRYEMDTIGQFLDEMTVQNPGARTYSGELYTKYNDWCLNSGFHPLSHTKFGLDLKERGLKKGRDGKGKFYHDIGLLSQ